MFAGLSRRIYVHSPLCAAPLSIAGLPISNGSVVVVVVLVLVEMEVDVVVEVEVVGIISPNQQALLV